MPEKKLDMETLPTGPGPALLLYPNAARSKLSPLKHTCLAHTFTTTKTPLPSVKAPASSISDRPLVLIWHDQYPKSYLPNSFQALTPQLLLCITEPQSLWEPPPAKLETFREVTFGPQGPTLFFLGDSNLPGAGRTALDALRFSRLSNLER